MGARREGCSRPNLPSRSLFSLFPSLALVLLLELLATSLCHEEMSEKAAVAMRGTEGPD